MATRLCALIALSALGGCCLAVERTGSSATSSTTTACGVPSDDPTTTVTTLAGNGTLGFFDGSGGRNGTSQFADPSGVALDAVGNIYVADYQNFRIRKVDPAGNTTTVAGNGTDARQDGTGGPHGTAEFAYPAALTIDDAGNILVVDLGDARARQVDSSGNVTTLPCIGTMGTPFLHPVGIGLDSVGNILLSDYSNNRVCRFGQLDGFATTLAGGGQPGNMNGVGTSAELNHPIGVAVDSAGSVYVGDSQNNLIRKIDAAGNVTTFAGDGDAGFADGPSSTAQFNRPSGLAVDPRGNVIVADQTNNRIRWADPSGNTTTLAGNGQAGDADGAGGANGAAEFKQPVGVAIDGACNVYVAGGGDNRIRKITFQAPPP